MMSPWIKIAFQSWGLALEASAVIALRSIRIAQGGHAAEAEARRMAAEKIAAGFQLQQKALAGTLGATPHEVTGKVLAHYGAKVRRNRKRLSRRAR